MWTCVDGREVLFNRYYEPMWSRIDRGFAKLCSFEWVKNIKSHDYFFDDGNPPWDDKRTRAKCEQILGKFVAGEKLDKEIDAHRAYLAKRAAR